MFVKFRKKGDTGGDGWSHATLSTDVADHKAPNGATLSVGLSDDRKRGVGVFVYRAEVGSGANNWKEVTLADGPTLVAAHKAYRENGGSFKALLVSLLTSDSFLYRTLPAYPERNR